MSDTIQPSSSTPDPRAQGEAILRALSTRGGQASQLEVQVQELRRQLGQANEAGMAKDRELAAARDVLDRITGERDGYERQYKDEQAAHAQTQQALAAVEGTLGRKNREYESLNQTCEALQGKAADLETAVGEATDSHRRTIEELQTAAGQLAQAREEAATYTREAQQAKARAESLAGKLEEKNRLYAELEKQFGECEDGLSRAEAALSSEEEAHGRVRGELELITVQLGAARQDVDRYRLDAETARGALASTEAAYERERAGLQDQIDRLQGLETLQPGYARIREDDLTSLQDSLKRIAARPPFCVTFPVLSIGS